MTGKSCVWRMVILIDLLSGFSQAKPGGTRFLFPYCPHNSTVITDNDTVERAG
jgi:hypothetical protein